jgi:hypothetical protein
MHQRSSRSHISRALGNKVRDLARGVIERDFDPAPFETRISLTELEIIHEAGYLPALVFAEAELGFDYVAAVALELIYALLDEVALGTFLGDGYSGPGAGNVRFNGLAETNGVLIVGC